MSKCIEYTINVGGKLLDLSAPCVMGILNVTPDSFYTSVSPDGSTTETDISGLVGKHLADGATIIDIGGCSTRPGSKAVDEAGEWERLAKSLDIIKRDYPDAIISVDTFRPAIAERCIREYGVHIINDVSGGCDEMFDVVAKYGVPYILTFNEPRNESENICIRELQFFAEKVQQLRDRGAKDIILDPGFGFNKSMDDNYAILSNMENLAMLDLPVLVGVSHKSMIFKLFGTTPAKALNGTTILNTVALAKGANILRVHEVREAMECIAISNKLHETRISPKSNS
jgi:dihydropteroate synthase